VDEPLETLKARFCRLIWAETSDVSSKRIEAGLQHLDVISSGGAGGTTCAVVAGFSEIGFGRFRQEVPVEVTRVESLSLEEIFIALCSEERGGRS